jgi:hypothetical protein
MQDRERKTIAHNDAECMSILYLKIAFQAPQSIACATKHTQYKNVSIRIKHSNYIWRGILPLGKRRRFYTSWHFAPRDYHSRTPRNITFHENLRTPFCRAVICVIKEKQYTIIYQQYLPPLGAPPVLICGGGFIKDADLECWAWGKESFEGDTGGSELLISDNRESKLLSEIAELP